MRRPENPTKSPLNLFPPQFRDVINDLWVGAEGHADLEIDVQSPIENFFKNAIGGDRP